ncbi:MAG: GNAT family N-acetyltransferase [Acidimicrobiia bacterium]
MSDFTIRALDDSTWEAFADLAANSGGWPSGCWCMAFHEEGAEKNSAALNRKRKMGRVMSGTAHAALVFEDDDCVGWCQFGSPEELPRIKSRAAYDKSAGNPPDWRIGCCYVAKGHRRQGVFQAGLAGALDLIAYMGGGVVEGYPEPADAVSAGFLYNGALSTYEQLGFTRDRLIGKHRWVVKRTVASTR